MDNKLLLQLSLMMALALSLNSMSFSSEIKLLEYTSAGSSLLAQNQIYLTVCSENARFDRFIELPLEALRDHFFRILSFPDLSSVACTSQENNRDIEQYREMQKQLSKEYLCARDEVLAQKIKRDNPNLPLVYVFPKVILPEDKPEERTMLKYCFLVREWKDNVTIKGHEGREIFFQKQSECFLRVATSLEIACLSGNYDAVTEF
jgi:hypothetical protein